MFCDRNLCSDVGTCAPATGLCNCSGAAHVNATPSLLCAECDGAPDGSWGWGPPPGGGETPCTTYCNSTASTYLQCIGETVEAACDGKAYCAGGVCAHNWDAGGLVQCQDAEGKVHNCSVPSSAPNADAVNLPCYNLNDTLPQQDCSFCSGQGVCVSGTCACGGGRTDAADTNHYHGSHCAITCERAGVSTECSGHGVCVHPNASMAPFCVCDGDAAATFQYEQWVRRGCASGGGGGGDLAGPAPAPTPKPPQCPARAPAKPTPHYFGLYCEKHAPLRYVQAEAVPSPSPGPPPAPETYICSNHAFSKRTRYGVVLNDTVQGWVQDVPCSIGDPSIAQCCGQESDAQTACASRADIFCDASTNLCTKLECDCPPDFGGGNCGVHCAHSEMNNCGRRLTVSAGPSPPPSVYQVCVASACGEKMPDLGVNASSDYVFNAPCSRGRCVASAAYQDRAGDTNTTPSASLGAVPGACACNLDPDVTGPCQVLGRALANFTAADAASVLGNQTAFTRACCARNAENKHYSGGVNGFCGSDCACSPTALRRKQGVCESPSSDVCTCKKDNDTQVEYCGSDCSGVCDRTCVEPVAGPLQRRGSCLKSGYNSCGCDCTGGFIQKTDTGFGVTKARMFVGNRCEINCFPPSARILNMTLPGPRDPLTVQQSWLNQYLADFNGTCGGYGICIARNNKPGCLCDSGHTGEFCTQSCYDATWAFDGNNDTMPEADALRDYGYRGCPHGDCDVKIGHDSTNRLTCRGLTFAPGANMSNYANDGCDCSSDMEYVRQRCLCSFPAFDNLRPRNRSNAFALGIVKNGQCPTCSNGQVPAADCAKGFLSKGNASKYVQSCSKGSCNDAWFGDQTLNSPAVSENVPVATRFALKRDCSINYTAICNDKGMSVFKDDYYWVDVEQDWHCVCSPDFFVTGANCTECALFNVSNTLQCKTTEPGQFFPYAGQNNCSGALIDYVNHPHDAPPLLRVPLVHATGALWPTTLNGNARWTDHTFCNRAGEECRKDGVLLKNKTHATFDPNTLYVGRFNCNESSGATRPQHNGYNCVRRRDTPRPRASLEVSTGHSEWGEYGELRPGNLTPVEPIPDYTSFWCEKPGFNIGDISEPQCNPQKMSELNLSVALLGVPFAAMAGAATQWRSVKCKNAGCGGDSLTTSTLQSDSAQPAGQCYNAFATHMGTGNDTQSPSPLCRYALMYGLWNARGLAVPPEKVCGEVYDDLQLPRTPSVMLTQKLPMLMTGDSCRDMLLRPDYVESYMKWLKSTSPADQWPLNKLETTDTQHPRFLSTFKFIEVQGFAASSNPFIVSKDAAMDYYCNPRTYTCQSGRDKAAERDATVIPGGSATMEIAPATGDIGRIVQGAVVYEQYASPIDKDDCITRLGQYDLVRFFKNVNSTLADSLSYAKGYSMSMCNPSTPLYWVHYDDASWYMCGNETADADAPTTADGACSCRAGLDPDARCQELNASRTSNAIMPPDTTAFNYEVARVPYYPNEYALMRLECESNLSPDCDSDSVALDMDYGVYDDDPAPSPGPSPTPVPIFNATDIAEVLEKCTAPAPAPTPA